MTAAIVVLGHTNDDAGRLSPIARARADAALKAWHAAPGSVVLTTGGWGSFNRAPLAHGTYVGEHLVAGGLPSDALLPVAPTMSTAEDVILTKPILAQHGVDDVTVVTCNVHMPRARAFFTAGLKDMPLEFVAADAPWSPEEVSAVGALEARKVAQWEERCARHRESGLFLLQMSGEPGSGKSSLARAIGAATGALVLDFDVIKTAALHGGTPWTAAGPAAHQQLRAVGHDILSQGRSVILDSCSAYPSVPAAGSAIAWMNGAAYGFIDCAAPVDVIEERMAVRDFRRSQRRGRDAPPADWTPNLPGQPASDAVSGWWHGGPVLRVDSTLPLRDGLSAAVDYLRGLVERQPGSGTVRPVLADS